MNLLEKNERFGMVMQNKMNERKVKEAIRKKEKIKQINETREHKIDLDKWLNKKEGLAKDYPDLSRTNINDFLKTEENQCLLADDWTSSY